MPDQLFEHFTLDVTPPPVEQVRLRGDRRRRRTAVAATGTACVVAAAAVGVVISTGGGADRAEPPASTTHWVTTIAPDFPLGAGTHMAQSAMRTAPATSDLPADSPIVKSLFACTHKLTWVTSDSRLAGLVSDDEGPGSPAQTRTLGVFSDDKVASGRLDAMKSLVQSCPEAAYDGPKPTVVGSPTSDAAQAPVGDESLVWVTPGADATFLTLAVRVGNAVLLEQTTEARSTDATSAAWAAQQVGGVVAAMCVYAATPCDSAAPTGSTSTSATSTPGSVAAGTMPKTFGPDGYGNLRLGMRLDQAVATGELLVSSSGSDQQSKRYTLRDGRSMVCFAPGGVLTGIIAPDGSATPAGVGDGSSAAAVRSAFHLGSTVNDVGWSVPAGGAATYHFGLTPGVGMTNLSLETHQNCWG